MKKKILLLIGLFAITSVVKNYFIPMTLNLLALGEDSENYARQFCINGLIQCGWLLLMSFLWLRREEKQNRRLALMEIEVKCREYPEQVKSATVLRYALAVLTLYAGVKIWKVAAADWLYLKIGSFVFLDDSVGEASVTFFIMMILIVGVWSPISEEFFFRKILFGETSELSPVLSGIVVSALFAFSHQDIEQVIPAFLLALLLSYVYFRSGNVALCIVLHGLYNVAGLLVSRYVSTDIWSSKAMYDVPKEHDVKIEMYILLLIAIFLVTVSALITIGKEEKKKPEALKTSGDCIS